jgi:hypothetical protein
MITGVCDIDTACWANGNSRGLGELGLIAWAAVAAVKVPDVTRTSHRGDGTVRSDPADAIIVGVCDVESAVRSHRYAFGMVKIGLCRRPTIAAVAAEIPAVIPVAGVTRACHRGDGTVRSDPADAMIAGVYDVEIAVRSHRYAVGKRQLGLCSRPTIAAVTGVSGARHRRDGAVRSDPADAIIAGVCDVEVAVGTHGHAFRMSHLGLQGRTAIAAVTAFLPKSDNTSVINHRAVLYVDAYDVVAVSIPAVDVGVFIKL